MNKVNLSLREALKSRFLHGEQGWGVQPKFSRLLKGLFVLHVESNMWVSVLPVYMGVLDVERRVIR